MTLSLTTISPKIYDLNNVPLISGVSVIKWHLPHSIHSEHRGRTEKCPIAHHRVEYGYAKIIPIRIVIDRGGSLSECPIEFEVLQEFSTGAGADERVTLGTVRLNLSEYVEESESLLRPSTRADRPGPLVSSPGKPVSSSHTRQRSSLSRTSSLGSSVGDDGPANEPPAPSTPATRSAVDDGVVRRYLMQDSKINSTLKVGILMEQVDGERNFIAPPLKTAAVFGGIAGILPGESLEPAADISGPGSSAGAGLGGASLLPPFNKSRDAHELQDMYRRALAASWVSQPDELPADECIEDIFSGGDGFRSSRGGADGADDGDQSQTSDPHRSVGGPSLSNSASDLRQRAGAQRDDGSGDEDNVDAIATLRPRDLAKLRDHVAATRRGAGEPSKTTPFPAFKDPRGNAADGMGGGNLGFGDARRDVGKDEGFNRSRSGSLASLATTIGSSEKAKDGFKRPKEVDELDVREDLVAWSVTKLITS